jgi:hypothetical protein
MRELHKTVSNLEENQEKKQLSTESINHKYWTNLVQLKNLRDMLATLLSQAWMGLVAGISLNQPLAILLQFWRPKIRLSQVAAVETLTMEELEEYITPKMPQSRSWVSIVTTKTKQHQ